MEKFYIRSAALYPLTEVLRELAVEPDAIFDTAGITPQIMRDPDAQISHQSFLKLSDTAVAATGCEHIGLLVGEKTSLQALGVLGLLLKSSSSFGVALESMIAHLEIHAKGIIRKVYRENNVAWITSTFELPAAALSPQVVQMSVATIWKICQQISHHQWNPRYVCFEFAKPANAAFYRHFFKLPVVFDAEFNGVVFEASDLELRLQEHDPLLHQEMQRQAYKLEQNFEDDFVTDVKNLIRQNLDVGICSEDAVVRYFPFQKRTFQMRLKREGVSYQLLLDEIRFQKAEFYLLKSRIQVTQLSDLLCYKSSSVFSTAFKKRYGVSPAVWRRNGLV
jgi:AraC-like DNA-binding protein